MLPHKSDEGKLPAVKTILEDWRVSLLTLACALTMLGVQAKALECLCP